jgi:hypothetical protein
MVVIPPERNNPTHLLTICGLTDIPKISGRENKNPVFFQLFFRENPILNQRVKNIFVGNGKQQ